MINIQIISVWFAEKEINFLKIKYFDKHITLLTAWKVNPALFFAAVGAVAVEVVVVTLSGFERATEG